MPLISVDLSVNCLGKLAFANGWSWLDGRVLRATLQNLNLSQNNVGIDSRPALHNAIDFNLGTDLGVHFRFS